MRSRARGFTLVELLMVIAIIGILAGLLMPALGVIRANGRSASCQNNLSHIGKAIQSFLSRNDGLKLVAKDWTSLILPDLEGQEGTTSCPEFVSSGAVGYGMNNLSQLFGPDDARKILVLDYNNKIAEVVGPKVTDTERAKRWDTEQAPRHAGQINILHGGGNVTTKAPDDIDPVSKEIHDQNWLPFIPNKERIEATESYLKGLKAEYRYGAYEFGGDPARIRLESDLNLPWGGGSEGHYGDGAKHPFFGTNADTDYFKDPHTTVLTGEIKADYSEMYSFRISSDDYCQITINGQVAACVPEYTWTGPPTNSGQLFNPFQMQGGVWVPIEIKFCNDRRVGSHMWVKWSSASTPEAFVPNSALRVKKFQEK